MPALWFHFAAVLLLFGATDAAAAPVKDQPLVWNSTFQRRFVRDTDGSVRVAFSVTNVSPGEVVVTGMRTSCACTKVDLPALPWALHPGQKATVTVAVDLTNKEGNLTKTAWLDTSAGPQQLTVDIRIAAMRSESDRQVSQVDRQAVVARPECAVCHLAGVTADRSGKELFQSVCAICHRENAAPGTAPDLARLVPARDPAVWSQSIAQGKPGTLMPAFGLGAGGPLSEAQIASLIRYLFSTGKPPR